MSQCGDTVFHISVAANNSISYREEVIECTDVHYIEAAFLALLSVLVIALNVLVAVTVCSSYTLKKKPLNLILASLAGGGVLEGVVGLPLSAAFAARQIWPLGEVTCRVDAALGESLLIVTSLSVMLLCADRALMMKYLHHYRKHMTIVRRNLAIAFSWILPLLMTVPVFLGQVLAFPHRGQYSCSTVDDSVDVIHGAVLLVLGHAIPSIVMLICVLKVSRIVRNERKQLKKLQLKRSFAYTEQVFVTPQLKTEQGPTIVVFITLVLYATLCLPQIYSIHLDQILLTHNITALELELREVWEARQNVTNSTLIGFDEISIMPVIPSHGWHEHIFMWMRCAYLVLQPLVVLRWHKDLRKKVEGLLFCCRPNSVDDYASVRPISAYVKQPDTAKGKKSRGRSQGQITGYKTPVLFSTGEGLHMRVLDDTSQRSNMRFLGLDLSLRGSFSNDPDFEIILCDVFLPAEDHAEVNRRAAAENSPDVEFPDTIELMPMRKMSSAETDSGVEDDTSEKLRRHAKKTVRFAPNSIEIGGQNSAQTADARLVVKGFSQGEESPTDLLKPIQSRASTPSPGAQRIRQRWSQPQQIREPEQKTFLVLDAVARGQPSLGPPRARGGRGASSGRGGRGTRRGGSTAASHPGLGSMPRSQESTSTGRSRPR